MRAFRLSLCILSLLAAASQPAAAFSLLGPDTTWMTVRLGYDTNPMLEPAGGGGAGFGGPMNIGEEYRINIPTVTWGCSPTFLNYFGLRGVQEIQKAINILNALPPADTINIDRYPLSSARVNYKAEALQLWDVKSVALSALVNHIGLADPTRFVFTLRNRWIGPSGSPTNYYVIKRNFDPDTWLYSSYINGQLWTYTEILDNETRSLVVNEPVDPTALGGVINAPVSSGVSGTAFLRLQGLIGGFWTGLTRDDVGGYRYIYRHSNFNNETAPTNSARAGFGAPVAGGNTSPWTIPSYGTNTTGTGTVGGSNLVDLALRPGIGKISFVRMIPESVIGSFVSNTVAWADTYLTNGVEATQNLTRTTTAPDILFDAGDLQGDDAGSPKPYFFALWTSAPWSSTGNGTTTFGPGSIPPALGNSPAFTFTFNIVGPTYWNVFNGSPLLNEVNGAPIFPLWGSFDGSAEDPVVYPDTASIKAIEAIVIGGGAGGTGTSTGAQVGVWTPAALVLLPVGTNLGTDTGTGTGTGTGGTGG
jgi:hypothetical protein